MASLDLLAGFATAHPDVYQFAILWQHVAGPACFFLRQLLNDMDLALLDPDIISAWMIEGDGDLLEEVEGDGCSRVGCLLQDLNAFIIKKISDMKKNSGKLT